MPSIAQQSYLNAEVQALLKTYRETYGFPGATAAYVWPDGSRDGAAVGLADIEAGTPMAVESRMLAASIGKTVWGALVMSLEKGASQGLFAE